jgi:predicted nucleic acid-binding protein
VLLGFLRMRIWSSWASCGRSLSSRLSSPVRATLSFWGLLSTLETAGNLTSDAHLAALAMEHDAEVCSTDFDFERSTALAQSAR